MLLWMKNKKKQILAAVVHIDVEIPNNFLSVSRYPRPLLKTVKKCPGLEGFQTKSFEKINASRSALELCQTIKIELFTTVVKRWYSK